MKSYKPKDIRTKMFIDFFEKQLGAKFVTVDVVDEKGKKKKIKTLGDKITQIN